MRMAKNGLAWSWMRWAGVVTVNRNMLEARSVHSGVAGASGFSMSAYKMETGLMVQLDPQEALRPSRWLRPGCSGYRVNGEQA